MSRSPRSAAMLLLAFGSCISGVSLGATPQPEPAALQPIQADWIGEGGTAGARLGWHAETAGDVNGDGRADIVGGAFMRGNGAGAAYLYYGRQTSLPASPDWLFACQDAGANCGFAVASAGDVNADGFDDLVVGANYQAANQSTGVPHAGRIYLFLGAFGGPSLVPFWTASPDPPGTEFGSGVSGAGDVNGDGYADFVATAPSYSNAEVGEGHALLWYGSASGPGAAPDWAFEPDIPGAALTQATSAGDVNGDGYGDLLIGGRQPGGVSHVWLFFGGPVGLETQPAWTAEGQPGAQFGFMINSAGDVNGDGYDDVIAVADLYDDPEVSEGAAFLWLGGPGGVIGRGITGTPFNADWRYEGNQASSFLRWADGVGDFTGDGYDDVVLGHALFSGGLPEEGRILIFAGSPQGLGSEPAFVSESNLAGARLGWAAEGAGDVNGDGLQDIVAGAERYTNGQFEEGALFVYLGRSLGCDVEGNCAMDNCPYVSNPGQEDTDHDGRGDACDNCPSVPNAGQQDADGDGIGDVCDSCPTIPDSGADSDQDGVGNACDNCRDDPNANQSDADADGVGDLCDNCPSLANPGQEDADQDGMGEACDNCPGVFNPTQIDQDFDAIGDACDACPFFPDPTAVCDIQMEIFVDFKTAAGKGSGLVTWTSFPEIEVTGYNLIVLQSDGSRTQINAALIPCQQCGTGLPASYATIVPKHKGAHDLFVELVRTNGAVETFGPAIRR